MKILIESTDQLTRVNGVPVRVWEGTTEAGTPCVVFVHLLSARSDRDCSEFERELKEQLLPAELVDLRRVLP